MSTYVRGEYILRLLLSSPMRLSLLALLFAVPVAAQAPDTLLVPLTHEVGVGPFGEISFGLRPEPELEALIGVPDSLDDVMAHAWAISDTTGADAVASFVVGRDGRRNHVVLVDTDNDERLDDETPLVLRPYWLAPNRERAGKALVGIPAEVEVGPERRAVRATLEINPYINNANGEPWLRGDGETYYFLAANRHAWGLAPSGDSVYVMPSSPRSTLASPWGLRVRVAGMAEDEEDYGLDDIVALGDRAYRVLGVADDGSAVRLVEAPEGVPEVGLRVGRIAPDFAARTAAGDSLRLGDLRGRYVLLDFWGTWCTPCRWQTPTLREMAAAYDPERLLLVGIADDDPEAVAAYVAEEGLTWPQIVEGRERPKPVHEAYAIHQWPSTFLVDPEGRIVAKQLYADMAETLAEHVGPPDAREGESAGR